MTTFAKAMSTMTMTVLLADTTIDSEGKEHPNPRGVFPVDLGTLRWQNLGPAPMDAYCTAAMWKSLLPNVAIFLGQSRSAGRGSRNRGQ